MLISAWLLGLPVPGWTQNDAQALWEPLPAAIPDVRVRTQSGKDVRFYSDLVQGRTVVINFIYTGCTTACPLVTTVLRNAQQQWKRLHAGKVHIISVSIDPVHDDPTALQAYAAKLSLGEDWTLVSGERPAVQRLLTALGSTTVNPASHTPLVLIGNEAMQAWTHLYGLVSTATVVATVHAALKQ